MSREVAVDHLAAHELRLQPQGHVLALATDRPEPPSTGRRGSKSVIFSQLLLFLVLVEDPADAAQDMRWRGDYGPEIGW
ncbi:hypothetical protein ACQPXM_11335 [Kribbella sp. CA-253562]|uniref:hypothetical protein n=1 Tax=Kribbella sp. CA-253562 TaxID=3239942 RepID=UPI003D8CE604